MIKLKHHVPRWLGGAAAAALLATSAHAQYSVANITASGTYEGGNTNIGGYNFVNDSAISQQYSLYFDTSTGLFDQSATTQFGSASETISNSVSSFNYSLSSVDLVYGHGTSLGGYTVFDLSAGGTAPLAFGFNIDEETNLFSGIGGTSTLTLSDLSPIFSTFQTAINDGNNPQILDFNNTYISGNAQDIASTVNGTVEATPEPTTLALAGLGSLSLLLFRRRK
jgi:hypothetical protein